MGHEAQRQVRILSTERGVHAYCAKTAYEELPCERVGKTESVSAKVAKLLKL